MTKRTEADKRQLIDEMIATYRERHDISDEDAELAKRGFERRFGLRPDAMTEAVSAGLDAVKAKLTEKKP